MDALWDWTESPGKPTAAVYFHFQRERLPANNPTPIQTRLSTKGEL